MKSFSHPCEKEYHFSKGKPYIAGRGITKHHFALFVGHLIDTLKDYGINDQDVQNIIGRINTYANEITGGVGSVGYPKIHNFQK